MQMPQWRLERYALKPFGKSIIPLVRTDLCALDPSQECGASEFQVSIVVPIGRVSAADVTKVVDHIAFMERSHPNFTDAPVAWVIEQAEAAMGRVSWPLPTSQERETMERAMEDGTT